MCCSFHARTCTCAGRSSLLMVIEEMRAGGSGDLASGRFPLLWVGCCCLLNASIRSGACMFVAGSHESWAVLYPFHLTRYCFSFLLPNVLAPIVSLTSHSGLSLIISGGGSRWFGLWIRVS